MKKIALFLMAAFAFAACEEEFVPHLDFPPTEVTIPTAGTENLAEPVTVTFNANAAWTAALTGEGVAEWLSISPKSGVAGDAAIKLDAIANTTKENRSAVLEITVEGMEPVLVNVTQLQKNAIDVNAEDAYVVSYEGETVEIEVGYNVEYTYEVAYPEETEPWLVETKAYATDKLILTAPAQEVNALERSAQITIYSELGVVKVIEITQEAWTVAASWTISLSEIGAVAGRAGVAVSGDKVYFTANGELWAADEATGEGAAKIALPDGFVAGGVHSDDAGNLLVSGPDCAWAAGHLMLYMVKADGSYELLVDYDSANYYCTEMGNFRVKGDVTKNALITAYICVGTGHYAAWEVKDGVVAAPTYGDLPEGSWDSSTGVVAPVGTSVADGLFSITYGTTYDLYYYDGTEWSVSYKTGAIWDENHNCISIAEVDDKVYLARVTGSFATSNLSDLSILDVTDPKSAVLLYSVELNTATANDGGFSYSDVYVKAENGKLAAYVIDPWMDVVEKYLFPLN